MSLESLNNKIQKGKVTRFGAYCILAAIESVSPEHNLPVELYSETEEFLSENHSPEEFRNFYRKLFACVGADSKKDVSGKRPSTSNDLERILHNAEKGNRRVIAFVEKYDEIHAVGVLPNGDGTYRIIDQGGVRRNDTVEELFTELYHTKNKNDARIITLPPERKNGK